MDLSWYLRRPCRWFAHRSAPSAYLRAVFDHAAPGTEEMLTHPLAEHRPACVYGGRWGCVEHAGVPPSLQHLPCCPHLLPPEQSLLEWTGESRGLGAGPGDQQQERLKLVENAESQPRPRPPKSGSGLGPGSCILTGPPRDSDAHSSLGNSVTEILIHIDIMLFNL